MVRRSACSAGREAEDRGPGGAARQRGRRGARRPRREAAARARGARTAGRPAPRGRRTGHGGSRAPARSPARGPGRRRRRRSSAATRCRRTTSERAAARSPTSSTPPGPEGRGGRCRPPRPGSNWSDEPEPLLGEGRAAGRPPRSAGGQGARWAGPGAPRAEQRAPRDPGGQGRPTVGGLEDPAAGTGRTPKACWNPRAASRVGEERMAPRARRSCRSPPPLGRPRSCCQDPRQELFRPACGGATKRAGRGLPPSGPGGRIPRAARALRSTLPLGVSGSRGRTAKREGTM